MGFSAEQLTSLKAKLNPDHVASRSQSGRTLSYVEGWHVIAEANRIFGFDAWDRELVSIKLLGEPRSVEGKARVGYMATVRVTVRSGDTVTVRDGTGFGSGIDKDVDQAHESALKEAETDAMKRALMTFGNPFGLALYDKTQASVGLDEPKDGGDPTVCDALIGALEFTRSVEDLADWKNTEKATIDSLSDFQFERFKKAYAAKRKALASKAPNMLEAG